MDPTVALPDPVPAPLTVAQAALEVELHEHPVVVAGERIWTDGLTIP